MSDLISVIIPVYNVEKFLPKCIESVVNQTYVNIEILLIDDGSTDSSGKICDNYAKLDQRITVVHQVNEGVSGARNNGMKLIHGNYVAIIDSDDFLDLRYIEVMYDLIKKEAADIVRCGHFYSNEEGECFGDVIDESYLCRKVLDKKTAMQMLIEDCEIQSFTWDKLYRRNILEGIEFPAGRYNQDIAIMHRIFDKAEKVVWTNEKLYFYRQREGSILHSRGEKLNRDQMFAYEQRIDFLQKDYPELKEQMVIRYVNFCIACYCWAIKENKKNMQFDIFGKLKKSKKEIMKKKYGDKKFRLKVFFSTCRLFPLVYIGVKRWSN